MRLSHSEVEDFTDADLQKIYAKVEDLDVVSIDAFKDEFLDRLEKSPAETGIKMPWGNTHDKVRLRMGECSVIAGINGHKKSTFISQIMVHAAQECMVGLASFEMDVEDTAKLMCKQAVAVNNPSRQVGERFAEWIEPRFCWYRVLGGVKPLQSLGAIAAMAERGCKLIVIDNLQFTGVSDDIERERLWFNQVIGLASALKVHICIIHHVRKPDRGGDEYVPTRFDIRGGSTIVDQCHLLIIVWHNKLRAKIKTKQEYGISLDDKERKILQEQADFRAIVAKQRKAPFEGIIQLYDTAGQTFSVGERVTPPKIQELL